MTAGPSASATRAETGPLPSEPPPPPVTPPPEAGALPPAVALPPALAPPPPVTPPPAAGATATEVAGPAVGGAPEATAKGVLRAISVVAPAGFLTALVYYFGWAATHASAGYLGIDESVLGYTTQDYLLSSIQAIFWPLSVGLAAAALALQGHAVLFRWDPAGPRRRAMQIVALVLALVGAALATYGVVALQRRWIFSGFSVAPLCATVGIGLVAYAVVLRNRLAGRARTTSGESPPLTVVLISMLLAVGLFWEVQEWASAVGIGATRAMVADLRVRPEVTLFSEKELGLAGPGVTTTPLSKPDGAFRYRYSGLRLLFRSNGRYFLLSDPWTRKDGVLYVIEDGQDVRLQFSP